MIMTYHDNDDGDDADANYVDDDGHWTTVCFWENALCAQSGLSLLEYGIGKNPPKTHNKLRIQ